MTDKATDVAEFKPCPFCGAIEAVLHPLPPDARGFYSLQDRGPYYGHCDNCGADGPGKGTEAEAIAAWNHRAASEQPASGEVDLRRIVKGWLDWYRFATRDDDNEYLNGKGWDDAEALAETSMGKLAALSTTSEAPDAGRLREELEAMLDQFDADEFGSEGQMQACSKARATLTPSALSGEPVQKMHELPRDLGARAIELLREYYDAEEIDDVGGRMAELGACRFSVRAFLDTVPSALAGDAGEGETLPRLDDGLIEAALIAHYGKGTTGINGLDLTADDVNWTFRDGFKRMWAGIREELRRRAALSPPCEGAE